MVSRTLMNKVLSAMSTAQETPKGFMESSQEFLSAANLVLNRSEEVSLPSYFLLGRSIELSLKAFLLQSGVPIRELRKRKYGHDLTALLKASFERGIDKRINISSIEQGVIELLNYDYMDKRFEYRISGGTYYLPLIDVTCEVAHKLAFNLEPFCTGEATDGRT